MSTVLAAVMIMSRHRSAISTVSFLSMIAVFAPFAFLLAFMILMLAGACWWNSALLISEAISWSIVLGSGTLSSLLRIRRLSVKVEPVVGAGAVLASFVRFRGGTVSHCLVGVGTDVVTAVGVDVVLGVGDRVGAGAWFGFAKPGL